MDDRYSWRRAIDSSRSTTPPGDSLRKRDSPFWLRGKCTRFGDRPHFTPARRSALLVQALAAQTGLSEQPGLAAKPFPHRVSTRQERLLPPWARKQPRMIPPEPDASAEPQPAH